MKRLIHIVVLSLALLGLSAPGLLAAPAGKHCARGAIWSHSPAVVGVPASAELTALPAPQLSATCLDHAVMVTAFVPGLVWRGALPALSGSTVPPPQLLAEAELPPPRGV